MPAPDTITAPQLSRLVGPADTPVLPDVCTTRTTRPIPGCSSPPFAATFGR
jgi:hypothetical protein